MSHQNNRRARANRENAKKSTGPRTPEGKTKSSMNALKHGLLANSVVVPDCPDLESQEHFNELLESLSDEYNPVGVIEQLLVETIAVSYWRLRRALRMEAAEIANKANTHQKYFSDDPIGLHSLPGINTTHMILRYETIIERRLNRATTRLEHLQQKRKHNRRSAFRTANGGEKPDMINNSNCNRVTPSNSFGGDSKHPAPGTHPATCGPDVRPGFNTHHDQKPNEPNPPQPYAPSFLKPCYRTKTTPAGYVAYQPCKSSRDKM